MIEDVSRIAISELKQRVEDLETCYFLSELDQVKADCEKLLAQYYSAKLAIIEDNIKEFNNYLENK